MVKALITLSEHENRVLNIVKGKFGLRNKSEAISLIIRGTKKRRSSQNSGRNMLKR